MSANETDGGAKPPSGFTFADKRKINPTGPSVTPAAEPELVDAELIDEESIGAEPRLGDGVAYGLAPSAGGLTPEEFEVAHGFEVLAAERLEALQRLQAEYANYRKRVERDRAAARDLNIASVVESLLPVLDDIYLARQHGDLESGPFASVADKLEGVLAKYGVERFGEPGTPFDPSFHDALMHVEQELAEGTDVTTVVGILQPGYRIGDKIIRPARVSVADPS